MQSCYASQWGGCPTAEATKAELLNGLRYRNSYCKVEVLGVVSLRVGLEIYVALESSWGRRQNIRMTGRRSLWLGSAMYDDAPRRAEHVGKSRTRRTSRPRFPHRALQTEPQNSCSDKPSSAVPPSCPYSGPRLPRPLRESAHPPSPPPATPPTSASTTQLAHTKHPKPPRYQRTNTYPYTRRRKKIQEKNGLRSRRLGRRRDGADAPIDPGPEDTAVDLCGREGRRGQDDDLVLAGDPAGQAPQVGAAHLNRPGAQPQRRLQPEVRQGRAPREWVR